MWGYHHIFLRSNLKMHILRIKLHNHLIFIYYKTNLPEDEDIHNHIMVKQVFLSIKMVDLVKQLVLG